MNKYFDYIDRIVDKEIYIDELKLFVKGHIDFNELINGLNKDEIIKLKNIINNMINFEEKEYYYFIELPNSVYFSTRYPYSIIKTKLDKITSDGNIFSVVEPDINLEYINDNYFNEISGIKNGIKLDKSNWFKIVSLYPYLYERLYSYIFNEDIYMDLTYEELKYYVNNRIIEEIKNINLLNEVFNIKYIDKYDCLFDNSNSFDDLLNNKKQVDVSRLDKTLRIYEPYRLKKA